VCLFGFSGLGDALGKDAVRRSFLMLCNLTALNGLAALRSFRILVNVLFLVLFSSRSSRSSAAHSFAQPPQMVVVVITRFCGLSCQSQRCSLPALHVVSPRRYSRLEYGDSFVTGEMEMWQGYEHLLLFYCLLAGSNSASRFSSKRAYCSVSKREIEFLHVIPTH